ncbi:MAG: hypothetical protein WCT16_04875 [Candidatus Buchananbacteria bacterium]
MSGKNDLTDTEKDPDAINLPRIKGVVEIPNCGLYVKGPRKLKKLFRWLSRYYDIKDCSKDERYPSPGAWYARVKPDLVRECAKCNWCGSYISTTGTGVHGHRCESCGKVVMEKFTNGGTVRFHFTKDNDIRDIEMKVFGYDDDAKSLLLYPVYPDLATSKRCFTLNPQQVHKKFKQFSGDWQETERDGQKLIAIPKDNINLIEVMGQKRHCQMVKLFAGKEYGNWDLAMDDLPITESYMIYEAWRWAPLKPSPKLHEEIIHAAGMVSRVDYYYQDGRQAFCDIHLKRMRRFVHHFTTLDLNKWDRMISQTDLSGPGMIKAIARFCHPNPQVRNEPNIGNLIVAAAKTFSGEDLCENEVAAAVDALRDPKIWSDFIDIMERSVSE